MNNWKLHIHCNNGCVIYQFFRLLLHNIWCKMMLTNIGRIKKQPIHQNCWTTNCYRIPFFFAKACHSWPRFHFLSWVIETKRKALFRKKVNETRRENYKPLTLMHQTNSPTWTGRMKWTARRRDAALLVLLPYVYPYRSRSKDSQTMTFGLNLWLECLPLLTGLDF